MGLNKLTSIHKDRIASKTKDVTFKDCVNTISCGFDNVLHKNAYVTLRREASSVEREVYLTKRSFVR